MKEPILLYITSSKEFELDGPYCWDFDAEYFVGKPLFDDEMESACIYPDTGLH